MLRERTKVVVARERVDFVRRSPRKGVSPLPGFLVGKPPDSHARAPKLGRRESLGARLPAKNNVNVDPDLATLWFRRQKMRG